MPSRFSPVASLNGLPQPLLSHTSRPTPSSSPFRPHAVMSSVDPAAATPGSKQAAATAGSTPTTTNNNNSNNNTGIISRLRAGSLPQRTNLLACSTPFGPSLFSTNWPTGRDRANTLTSIPSSDGPNSPSQSFHPRDGLADNDVKTLDYLGLAESPQLLRHSAFSGPSVDIMVQQPSPEQQSQSQQTPEQQQQQSLPPLLAELAGMKNNNRVRSYSVNAKEKYAEDDELEYDGRYSDVPSGTLTPSAAEAAAQLAATQAEIHQHNLAVQAFANHASASRPRARTAGILEAPPQRSSLRNYLATPSRLDSTVSASDLNVSESAEYHDLTDAMQLMHLAAAPARDGDVAVPGLALRAMDLGDESGMDGGPTRALWIGSIPVSTTVTSLEAIFGMHGKIESTRVLTHKNCGFVNFELIESAMQAKSVLNGKEIFPGAGPVRIGYAKAPGGGTPVANGGGLHASLTPTPDEVNSNVAGVERTEKSDIPLTPQIPLLSELEPDIVQIVQELGTRENDVVNIVASVQRAVAFHGFQDEIPPVPEPSQARVFDAPRLRDIRKRIDNGTSSTQEIEETANDMLPEIAELSSDYLGNTVVQKLFEFCSEQTKEDMLSQIAPHLAEIGVHKNGTWAAQKIIDVAKTPTQMQIIVEALRPFTVPLFLDQYGNYVVQCCLRFGSPYNDFVFETMLSRMWDIAQGRFGARAMRACLESHHASKDQQRILAAAIALHSVQLATNANGALLLTWLLDTCTFPQRRAVLAPRLVPHLVYLCTHKIAYLTVLKVINQRNEPEARDIILKALFFSPGDEVLERILSDQASGATLIFKILTTPFFDEYLRADVVKNVSKVLTKLKATPNQGYKRLMDEIGLSSRGSSVGGVSGARENPSHHHHHHHPHHHHGREHSSTHPSGAGSKHQSRSGSRHGSSNFPAAQPGLAAPSAFAPGLDGARSAASDPPSFDPYGVNNRMGAIPGLNGGGAFGQDPAMLAQQQLQYQAYLAAAQSRGVSPAGLYPAVPPLTGSNFGYPAAATTGGPPAVDNLRTLQTSTPTLPQLTTTGPLISQPAFPGHPFSPVMNAPQMFPYGPPFYSQPPPAGQSRRGRMGHSRT